MYRKKTTTSAFSRELQCSIIEAWRDKYISYDVLSTKIQKIRKLYDDNNIPIAIENAEQLLRRMPSRIELLSTSSNGKEALFSDTDSDAYDRSSTFQLYGVQNVCHPNLTASIPKFEEKYKEISVAEHEFVSLLEMDIGEISTFYANKCKYYADQYNILIAKIKHLIDPTQSSLTDLDKSNIVLRSKSISFHDSNQQQPKLSKKQKNTKTNLRLLFRQIYDALRKLEQYREINEKAIYEITELHDKNSGKCSDLSDETKELIKKSNFGSNHFVKIIQKQLEHLFSLYLRRSRESKFEALEKLKAAPSHENIQLESCVIGLCGGWSVAIFLISCIFVLTLGNIFWDSQITKRSWYMFRASYILCIYLWLWGCDIWIFEKYHFNHGFIFDAKPSSLLRLPHIWNIAAVFTVTTMINTILYILAFLFPNSLLSFGDLGTPAILSVTMLFCWFFYIIIPYPKWIRPTKRYLAKSFLKQIISPFSTVNFIDFFIADQWTSLFTIVIDLSFSMCYLFTGELLLDGDTESEQCEHRSTHALLSMLKLVPYHVRFWQCIRRAWESKQSQKPVKKHLMNALKYSLAITTVFTIVTHKYLELELTKVIVVIIGAITTTYSYYWDIVKDWGLFTKNDHHKWLRSNITFSPTTYYVAMIINLLFRLDWAISLYPESFGITISMHYIGLLFNAIEVIRRCIWNVFRIEHEHLNNCGEFRVFKDVKVGKVTQRFMNVNTMKTMIGDVTPNTDPDEHKSFIQLNKLYP